MQQTNGFDSDRAAPGETKRISYDKKGRWPDDYAAQAPFRRSINRRLVRGGSVHPLERVIDAGPIRVVRGRSPVTIVHL
jgi:hypothetical protein